jgi:hypothetical protein
MSGYHHSFWVIVLLTQCVVFASPTVAISKPLTVAAEHEIYDARYSYLVLEIEAGTEEGTFFLAGTYSLAAPMTAQRYVEKSPLHVDGLWLKKVDRAGDVLNAYDLEISGAAGPVRVGILSSGEAIFLLGGASEPRLFRAMDGIREIESGTIPKHLNAVSLSMMPDGSFWVLGMKSKQCAALLVSSGGLVVAEVTPGVVGGFLDAVSTSTEQGVDGSTYFLAFEGGSAELLAGTGKVGMFRTKGIGHSILKSESDSGLQSQPLAYEKVYSAPGKYGRVAIDDGRFALMLDTATLRTQSIGVRSLSSSMEPLWEKHLVDVDPEMGPFDFTDVGGYWILAGAKSVRTFVVAIPKSGVGEELVYWAEYPNFTIGERVSCAFESCMVAGTRIVAEENEPTRNKVMLRVFDFKSAEK